MGQRMIMTTENQLEAAVVIGPSNQVIYWHLPEDRTIVSIRDSRVLWDVYWENRHIMVGQAHSHPGFGWPSPSWEDITSYQACENGLGKRYTWWIASSDRLVLVEWGGPQKYDYKIVQVPPELEPPWVVDLRANSRLPGVNTEQELEGVSV